METKSPAHPWLIVIAVVVLLSGWFVGAFTSNVGLIAVSCALGGGLLLYGLLAGTQRRLGGRSQ